jgi:hypothetical protein
MFFIAASNSLLMCCSMCVLLFPVVISSIAIAVALVTVWMAAVLNLAASVVAAFF